MVPDPISHNLIKDNTVVDYLQQGLEINFIIADKYKELLKIMVPDPISRFIHRRVTIKKQ